MTDAGVSTKSIVVPFLASGIIGAGVALFLAPKAGKELRKDIGKYASDKGAQVSGAVSEAYEKGRSKFQAGKESVTAFDETRESIAEKKVFSDLAEKRSSIVLPLVAGSITGAVLALAMAPKIGKDLRQDVKNLAQATAEQVAAAAGTGKTMVTKAIEAGAGRMKRAA